jgi:CRP-like cAMP-binding protein
MSEQPEGTNTNFISAIMERCSGSEAAPTAATSPALGESAVCPRPPDTEDSERASMQDGQQISVGMQLPGVRAAGRLEAHKAEAGRQAITGGMNRGERTPTPPKSFFQLTPPRSGRSSKRGESGVHRTSSRWSRRGESGSKAVSTGGRTKGGDRHGSVLGALFPFGRDTKNKSDAETAQPAVVGAAKKKPSGVQFKPRDRHGSALGQMLMSHGHGHGHDHPSARHHEKDSHVGEMSKANMEDFIEDIRERAEAENKRIEAEYDYAQVHASKHWVPMIRPDSKGKQAWDWLVTFSIFASLVTMPLLLGFAEGLDQASMVAIQGTVEAIWLIDILVTFRTAIKRVELSKESLIARPWDVARHYVTTHFLGDLIATADLPFVAMHISADGFLPTRLATGASNEQLMLYSVVSLLPMPFLLLRLRRIYRNRHVVASRLFRPSGIGQIIRITIGIFYLCHVVAGVYWYISVVQLRRCLGRGCNIETEWDGLFNPPLMYASYLPDGMRALVALGHNVTRGGEANSAGGVFASVESYEAVVIERGEGVVGSTELVHHGMASSYLCAFVWAMNSITGLQLERPTNDLQNLLVVLVASASFLTNAVLVGSVSSVIAQMNHARTLEQNQRKAIAAHLEQGGIPRELRLTIDRFYDFVGGVAEARPDAHLLPSLPVGLKQQLDLFKKREIFTTVPFFKMCTFEQVMDLVPKVERIFAMPGLVIIRQGNPSDGLFMLVRGSLNIVDGENNVLAKRIQGEFVGEMSLLQEQPATATVITKEVCELFLLRRDDFLTLKVKYPELETQLDFFAKHKDEAAHQAASTKHMKLQQSNYERASRTSKFDGEGGRFTSGRPAGLVRQGTRYLTDRSPLARSATRKLCGSREQSRKARKQPMPKQDDADIEDSLVLDDEMAA